ncbi:MAG: right-handed parallel beta-helix repeat-containing protein [Chloroflexaceae bacterium]|nr:right-handed parallel beta-helix repeat-containing protein [Chloroflexaceae bacterium]
MPPTQAPDGVTPTIPLTFPTLPSIPTIPPIVFPPPTPSVTLITGDVRWTTEESPFVINRDVELASNAILVIDPGVEVRMAPGAAIIVNGGQLVALGEPGRPVRFTAASRQRWEAIYGEEGSSITLDHAEITGGGATGTVLTSENGELIIRNSRFNANGGTILVNDSRVEMRDSEVAGNDLPYGGALNLNYEFGNTVELYNNRFGGNRLASNAAEVQIYYYNSDPFFGLGTQIQGNLFRGGTIANLLIWSEGPVYGTITCNALIGNQLGFKYSSQNLQVPPPRLLIENNFITEHTPPIEPVYLDFGIGRGAASEVALVMENNWWGDDSGPYHPELNPEGRGDAAGVNIDFEPWLRDPPPCAPPE